MRNIPGLSDLAAAVGLAANHAPWTLPILAAQQARELFAMALLRGQSFPRSRLEKLACPVLAIIGDDDHASTGPGQFPGAAAAIRWAASGAILLHAAAGLREHYAGAVSATKIKRRGLIIETSTNFLDQWENALRRWAPGRGYLVVRPGQDLPHPILPAELVQ